MHPTLTSIALSTGVTLPYVEHGDPAGVPLILLHGYSDSWRSWELLLPALSDSSHAYAPTQRGHGDADRPHSGYRPEDYAADVAAFMDAAGIEAAVIAGHSGGSYTAQRFALDHPQRTLGLVLIGSFRAFHDNPAVLELRDAAMALTDPVDPEFVREFQQSCVSRPLPDDFLDDVIAESRKLPARQRRVGRLRHAHGGAGCCARSACAADRRARRSACDESAGQCPRSRARARVGPCAVLMIGSRREDAAHYPVNAAAARYDASVTKPTDDPAEAYADWRQELSRPAPNPWPLS